MNTTKKAEFDYEAYTRENAPDASQIRRGPEAHKRRREAFRARLINHANTEIRHAREMRHVFISYCHENKATVDRLRQSLASHNVTVWVDWNNLDPGTPWKQAIQQAIHHGDFFIACFSQEYNKRDKRYVNYLTLKGEACAKRNQTFPAQDETVFYRLCECHRRIGYIAVSWRGSHNDVSDAPQV